jgi:hypothetical protein
MKGSFFFLAVLVLSPLGASGQQWSEFVSRDYRFSINFPSEPKTRDVSYITAEGSRAQARVFSAEEGTGYYSVTVVQLPPSANNLQVEIDHAAALLRQAGAVRIDDANLVDGIAARELSIVRADGRQLMATVTAYDGRLYIVEGNQAADAAPPIQFQQSIGVVDSNGNPVNVVE